MQVISHSLLDDDGRPRPQHLPHLVEAHVEYEVGVGQCAGLDHPPAERAEPLPHLVGAMVARWQNLIPSFPWIAPGGRAIKGKEGIKF